MNFKMVFIIFFIVLREFGLLSCFVVIVILGIRVWLLFLFFILMVDLEIGFLVLFFENNSLILYYRNNKYILFVEK